jgi:hypothetical protein
MPKSNYRGGRSRAWLEERVIRRTRRREFPGQIIVIELMQQIESLRERQRLLTDDLRSMLETGYPGCDYDCYRLTSKHDLAELRSVWDEFTAQGGITVDDLKVFLRGERISTTRVVSRKHLRLVRSRKPIGGSQPRYRYPPHDQNGNDAA